MFHFKKLFERADVVERHLAAPLLPSRLAYLAHRSQQGAARYTLRMIARAQLAISRYLELGEEGQVPLSRLLRNAGPPKTPPAAAGTTRQPAGDLPAARPIGFASRADWNAPPHPNHTPTTTRVSLPTCVRNVVFRKQRSSRFDTEWMSSCAAFVVTITRSLMSRSK